MQTFFVLEDQRGVREGQGKGKTRRGKEICQCQYGVRVLYIYIYTYMFPTVFSTDTHHLIKTKLFVSPGEAVGLLSLGVCI